MSSLGFEEIAVESMRAYLSGGAYTTELRAIETERGGGYTLEDPVDYVAAFVPGDNRSPLVQIYADGSAPDADAAHRHNLGDVRLVVVITYVGGGEDLPDEEKRLWRYVEALRRAVRADYRIGTGGTTIKFAIWESAGRDFPLSDESKLHHVRAVSFDVRVEDP